MRFSALLRRLTRRLPAVLAVAALPALTTGALWLDGPQSTFGTETSPLGPVAQRQLDLFFVTLWVTLALFAVTGSALAYATWKFRAKTAADEHAEPPPQGHGNPLVELGLVIGSTLCLVIIAVPTLQAIWYTHEVPRVDSPAKLEEMVKSGEVLRVKATGYQWWFKFDYTNERAKKSDGSDGGPLVTANELVIPVGKPVHIDLRTFDVIHSFWVPKLAGKVDMMPNRANHLWLQADQAGYYYGQCAEYCGDSHSVMRFRVIALEPAAYATWLAAQKLPALEAAPIAPVATARASAVTAPLALNLDGRDKTAPLAGNGDPAEEFKKWQARQTPPAQENTELISLGRRLFSARQCINCHTVRGHEGGGTTAPDLTHLGSRSTIAAGLLENTEARLKDWLTDPDHWKPSNKMFHGITSGAKIMMPGYVKKDGDDFPVREANGEFARNIILGAPEVEALAAYLQSLK
jgi:cytochrome c oxidase subunit 2